MGMKFTNNASTTLASGISAVATSLTVQTGAGALFPVLGAGDYFYCTLSNTVGNVEIIKVTARTGDVFNTIVRAQDNTTALVWNAGDRVELRLVSASLNDFPKLDETNTFTGTDSFTGGFVANPSTPGSIDNVNIGATTQGTIKGTTGTFTGTLTPQALVDISGASAGQVKFPSTQNASADVNTLDDYKEGTFTSALICGTSGTITMGNNVGRYTKIGNTVHFTGFFDVSSVSSPAGSLTLTGLPYTSGNNNYNAASVSIRVNNYVGSAGSVWQASIVKNSSSISLDIYVQAAGILGTNPSALVQANTSFFISGNYMVN